MSNESQNKRAVLEARHHDPFSYLGLHRSKAEYVFRVFQPYATEVSVFDGKTWLQLERVDAAGLFEWHGKQALPTPCRLRLNYFNHLLEVHDAFTFGSSISDLDLHLFSKAVCNRLTARWARITWSCRACGVCVLRCGHRMRSASAW